MKIENQSAMFAAAVAPPVILFAAAGGFWRFYRDLETAGILGMIAGAYIVLAVWMVDRIIESFDKTHNTNVNLNREFEDDEGEDSP